MACKRRLPPAEAFAREVEGPPSRVPPACLSHSSLLAGGLKCPVCSFVYGTKWEFNRHLKNKHGLKLVETEGEPKWEVTFESSVLVLAFLNTGTQQAGPGTGELVPRA